MNITTRIFSMLLIAATTVVISCKDEFTEEDALKAQQEIDLAIYVFNRSESDLPPVEGAKVTISQGGESREVTTDASGVALFPDAKIGGYIYRIEGENFTTLAGSNSFDPDNFRQGQYTEEYGVYKIDAENMAVIKGRVAIETDLTNNTTEYASGIDLIFEVNLDYGTQNFTTTTDAEGRYEIKVPADYRSSTRVYVRFPDLELDQSIVYYQFSTEDGYFPNVLPAVRQYPTLFSMYEGGRQNYSNYPTNIDAVYALAEEGEETAVIYNVNVNSDGEISSVNFDDGGNYSGFAKDSVDVTFTDILGNGSGALLRISVETYSDLYSAYINGRYRWVSRGSGYSEDYDLNYNNYESPSINSSDRRTSLNVYPGTTSVLNADYGTGVYREHDLD